MIVLLNGRQLNALLQRVDERHHEALTNPALRKHTAGHSHLHDLPAIAWRQMLDLVLANAYGPMGGKRHTSSVYSAAARIQQKLMRLEHHPALTGKAIVGFDNTVVPAFINSSGYWTIYPSEWGFRLFRPRQVVQRGWQLTQWIEGEPRRPGESATFEPECHQRFVSPLPSPL